MSIDNNKRTDHLPSVLPLVSTEGGRGEAVRNSGSVVSEGVSHSLNHYQSEEGIGTVLLALGVFALSSPRRLTLAVEIAAAGITSRQLRDLESYIHEGEPDAGKARRFLTAIICDLAKLRDAIDGLTKFRAASERKAPAGPAHATNMPVGSACCPCNACVAKRSEVADEPWDHDRQCRVAYCLHNGDRRTVAELAAFLEVSESTAHLMVERGRVLSQSAYVETLVVKAPGMRKAERDDKAAAERLREFREASRGGRLRLLQGEA